MTMSNPVELELNRELLDALRLAGLEVLWHPGQATISSDFKFEVPSSAKWMQIKSGVELGAYSYAVRGHFQNVAIGRYSSIGEDVQFGRGNHSTIPISNSPIFTLPYPMFSNSNTWRSNRLPSEVLPHEPLPKTFVGSDVWIGHGSFIKPGVVIGDGAIVGAESVVTKDVAPFSVVAGNPARLIRMRYSDDVIQQLLKIRWWDYSIEELDGIDFSDISAVLNFVPKADRAQHQNPTRSVEEFIFTREEMNQGSISSAHFFRHHSGFEYSVIESPNRFRADAQFVSRPRESLQFYAESIRTREPGRIYTFVNGANAALLQGDEKLAGDWLAQAINYRDEDEEFFGVGFSNALWRLLSLKNPHEAHKYLSRIGLPVPNQIELDLHLIVVGFPRCGTTSISTLVAEADELKTGLTLENFPPITRQEVDMDSLFESYELNLFLGEVIRQDNSPSQKMADKSTIFCLSKQLLAELSERYPNAKIYASTRDPFDRGISAYKRSQARFSSALCECVEKETEIIRSLGGVRAIFESVENLSSFLRACLGFGLDYPIVYPSALMKNWASLLSEDLKGRIILLSVTGQVDLSSISTDIDIADVPLLNSSSPLASGLSSEDKKSLQDALVDETLI